VVISDPVADPDGVLIVNFTTRRPDSDPACILEAGEHPFVKHQTCVNYAGAKVVSRADIQSLMEKGLLRNHAALSAALLKRIRDGAGASERMSLAHADILIEQGLLDCRSSRQVVPGRSLTVGVPFFYVAPGNWESRTCRVGRVFETHRPALQR
jgi:hypothetical protein